MRYLWIFMTGLLISSACAQEAADEGAAVRVAQREGGGATLDQTVVDNCLMCHRGELSLADRDADALAGSIADIAAGRLDHLVPVPALSDADRQALAAALTETDR